MLFPPPSSSSFSSGQESCPATLTPSVQGRPGARHIPDSPASRNTWSRRTNPTCVGDRRGTGGADAVGPGHYAAFPGIFHEECWKKSVPGSVPNAGCDRAQGRERRSRAAAATHERGWRGPGAARAPTRVQAIVAVGRVHLRGAGGRRRHVSGAGAATAARAPEPPGPQELGRPEEHPPPPSCGSAAAFGHHPSPRH